MSQELKTQIEEGINKLSDELEKVQEKQAEEIKNVGEAHEETKNAVSTLEETIKVHKDRLDEVEKKAGRVQSAQNKEKSFEYHLRSAIAEKQEEFRAMSAGRLKSVSVGLTEKQDDMTTGNTYTGEVIPADRLPGVHFDPDRPQHIRQLIPQITTTSDTIRYVQETAYNDGTAGQVEGQQKGQSDFDLEAKDAPVKTRAAFLRLSRQMLDDTNYLAGHINLRAPKKLFIDEDNQILYGDGTGENIEGISQVAQSHVQVLDADQIQHKWDAIGNGIAQVRTQSGEYQANRILLNPNDWWNLVIAKDNEGRYLMPDSVRAGAQPFTIGGVQVVANTAVNADEYFIGDFSMGATMAMRQGVTLEFFNQDRDNVVTNQVTVRIEERYALPIHNPNAFLHTDFTTVLGT